MARKFIARRCAREKANIIISFLLLFQKYQIKKITNLLFRYSHFKGPRKSWILAQAFLMNKNTVYFAFTYLKTNI